MHKPGICKGACPTWKAKPQVANITAFTGGIGKKKKRPCYLNAYTEQVQNRPSALSMFY